MCVKKMKTKEKMCYNKLKKKEKKTWKCEQQKLKKKIYQIEQLFLQTFLYERCRELYCKFFQYIFIFFTTPIKKNMFIFSNVANFLSCTACWQ